MNKVLAAALAASLALSASSAFAGGPVIVVEEPAVVTEESASSSGILPLVLVGIALCVALCGGNSDESRRVQDPVLLPAGG